MLGPDATFTNIYQGVFCKAQCRICHGSAGTAADLPLMPAAAAHAALVNVPAQAGSDCGASGTQLVAPNNPDISLLYQKLANTQTCGERMPPGDAAAITADMLARVREWIAAGASNN